MDRREFLAASGALVVSVSLPRFVSEASAQAGSAPGLPLPDELDSWVALRPDGRVSVFFGKMDMGQGLDVAVAQIVAEELDVSVERIDVVMGDTASSCNQGGGSNSSGIWTGAKPLRNAAAEARRILVDRAAVQLGVPTERLTVSDGVVSVVDDSTQRITYVDVLGGDAFNTKVTWNQQLGNTLDVKGQATPKDPSAYKVVGTSVPRRDVAGKVFGTSDFVTEISLPGMLHARVIRPPRAASTVVSVDEGSIRSIPGARVVRDKGFLAVVAPREWDAVRAAQMLRVSWSKTSEPFPPMDKIYDHIRAASTIKREEPVKKGDVDEAFKNAVRVVQAEYEWPFQSHASMGPACAVADVKADEATIWTGSQKPHAARDGVAKLLGLPPEKVRGIWVMGPGSYGRNDAGDAAIDAALLSKLTGKPVRVQGMRRDGTAWDPKGPASVHRGRAAFDASGKVIGYDFLCRGFSRVDILFNEADPRHRKS